MSNVPSWDDLTTDERNALLELARARANGSLTRRDALIGGGAILAGGAIGGGASQAVGTVAADASTTDADGDVGGPNDRVDVFAQAVDTDEVSLTDPTLVYVYGEGSNLLTTRDPANFADVFAAINDVLSGLSAGEKVDIQLPNTGSSGVSATTTLSVPTGVEVPNIYGYGEDSGTVINYGATDGTPAIDVVTGESNDGGFEWSGFRLVGPGEASTSGEAIRFNSTVAQSFEISHLQLMDFDTGGITSPDLSTLITGSIHHCNILRCAVGIDVEMNAGSIHNCLVQDCATAQIRLEDSLNATVHDCDIDASGITADGIIVRSDDKRGAPVIRDNYLEGCTTSIDIIGTLNNRKPVVKDNYIAGGSVGVRIATGELLTMSGNHFQDITTADIRLTGGVDTLLGENLHIGSATKLDDQTGGNYQVIDPKRISASTVTFASGGTQDLTISGSAGATELDVRATPANDPANDHGYVVDSIWFDDSAGFKKTRVSETEAAGGGDARVVAYQTFPYPW